ncbi:HEAT repeat domain-containing protein [Burkholderia sp. S-53]|uniref:HEAT repeat domain-containing protein n=1 Tax=Burkholderia sp. S-53 TaxID=2906514 RepID=UPI0021CEFA47|nr:HEAT repeat domain-containing protein [Burkholderia sp. S-53]UXU85577.1 MerR family transcriptional regulator [Burkholderia sp. S-53]
MRISELANRSGVSARMLRHYDAVGLVSPSGRTEAGYREYSQADALRLFQVESLRSLGLGLAEVRQALSQQAPHPDVLIDALMVRSRERLAAEQALLCRLTAVSATSPEDWSAVLEVVHLLKGLDSTHAPERQRAAFDAASSDAPLAALIAHALLQEQEPNVAGALHWALGRTVGSGASVLGAALQQPDPAVRERAVLALAKLGGSDAVESLRGSLLDPAERVRYRAARVLGGWGIRDAIPLLIEQVLGGTHDVEAADALADLAEDPAIAKQIVERFEAAISDGPADVQTRVRICQALAELNGTASALLARLAADPDPSVARNARYVMGIRNDALT